MKDDERDEIDKSFERKIRRLNYLLNDTIKTVETQKNLMTNLEKEMAKLKKKLKKYER